MFIKIKLWLIAFFHKFLYTRKEYECDIGQMQSDADKQAHAAELDICWLREKVSTLQNELDHLHADYDHLHRQYVDHMADYDDKMNEMADLRAELEDQPNKIARASEAPEVHAEYFRAVQKQLADIFENNQAFGFPYSMALPGSVCMSTAPEGFQNDTTVCRGRVILDDNATRKINSEVNLRDKLMVVIDFLDRYGGLRKIARDMIYNGAVSMTLAYRDLTTTYELFYQIAARNVALESILVFDHKTGLKVECPDVSRAEETAGEEGLEKREGEGA